MGTYDDGHFAAHVPAADRGRLPARAVRADALVGRPRRRCGGAAAAIAGAAFVLAALLPDEPGGGGREGRLVAFLVGFLSQDRADEAYIHFVGVDPEWQGSGVGRAMYERFFAAVRTAGRTRVRCPHGPGEPGLGRLPPAAGLPRRTGCARLRRDPGDAGLRRGGPAPGAVREGAVGKIAPPRLRPLVWTCVLSPVIGLKDL
ncbi:GNAT family N-acetyltransferase [Yinghuangia aomiensis]